MTITRFKACKSASNLTASRIASTVSAMVLVYTSFPCDLFLLIQRSIWWSRPTILRLAFATTSFLNVVNISMKVSRDLMVLYERREGFHTSALATQEPVLDQSKLEDCITHKDHPLVSIAKPPIADSIRVFADKRFGTTRRSLRDSCEGG